MGILVISQLNLLKPRSGIRLLRWSTMIFLLGEAFCGIDIYLFQQMTLVNELIHETAMMFSFSGFIWASLILINGDRNCLGFACPDRISCQINPRDCSQAQTIAGLLKAGLLGLILLTVMPFFVQPYSISETLVAGLGNRELGFYTILDYKFLWIFRLRLAPMVPLVAFGIVLIRLFFKIEIAKIDRILVYLGSGFLLFILNRLFLLYVFRDNGSWGNFFEEMQELIFILCLLIWSKKTFLPKANFTANKQSV